MVIDPRGYVLVYVGCDHHLAHSSGYAYKHRLVMEKKLGRRLKRSELVHHKDENKSNNKSDNLELMTRGGHAKHHKPRLGTASKICPKGHIKDYVKPNGTKICRICRREEERKRYHGNKK